MTIYINKDSKVIVQGITGGEGSKHTARMLAAGTQVVGGVNARKAGTTVLHTDASGADVELPVFASVAEAMAETGADVSIAFVPPAFTKDAVFEAIENGIELIVIVTERIPRGDVAQMVDDAIRQPRRHGGSTPNKSRASTRNSSSLPVSSRRRASAAARKARRTAARWLVICVTGSPASAASVP